jgi:hypothetical protein
MCSPRALDLSPPGGPNRHLNNSSSSPPVTPISHHPDNHEGSISPPPPFQQPPVTSASAAAAFLAVAAAAAAAATLPTSDHENLRQTGGDRPRGRSRRGRGRSSRGERMPSAVGSGSPRSLSEMSVRGLDLLRYATLAPDGTYRCVECERVQITKHFKNKYSFQRHAFLYHEGASRKVFPCSICQKEFSRPDKMKQHLKQAHDGQPKPGGRGKGGGRGNVGQSNPDDELPPSTLLINPFRGLSDPADMEGKITSIKESGSRC